MILSASLGPQARVSGSHGDVWSPAWAHDDNLYVVSDDTKGFDQACNSNLAVHRLTGTHSAGLRGETINAMSDYGALAELGQDRASWKANGLTAVDGRLYLSVSRHAYFAPARYPVQEATDASIVRSDDLGRTWSPIPEFDNAMFPGPTFGAPFFVQYGRDGHGATDDFVYAISASGVWNNGTSMVLGRVPRSRIEYLDPGDWEFVIGFDELEAPIWGRRHDRARIILRAPGQVSMTGVQYLEPLRTYVMPQWHYVDLNLPEPERWQYSRWTLYDAEQPWGPWRAFQSTEFRPQGFYNPSIVNKFISQDGARGVIFTAGDFKTGAYYALHSVPYTLEIGETRNGT